MSLITTAPVNGAALETIAKYTTEILRGIVKGIVDNALAWVTIAFNSITAYIGTIVPALKPYLAGEEAVGRCAIGVATAVVQLCGWLQGLKAGGVRGPVLEKARELLGNFNDVCSAFSASDGKVSDESRQGYLSACKKLWDFQRAVAGEADLDDVRLPDTTFDLAEAKRLYMKHDTPKFLEWFYKAYDADSYSIWRLELKSNVHVQGARTAFFRITALLGGLRHPRELIMGSVAVFGNPSGDTVAGVFIVQGHDLGACFVAGSQHDDYLASVLKLENQAHKSFFENTLGWTGHLEDGKPLLCGFAKTVT